MSFSVCLSFAFILSICSSQTLHQILVTLIRPLLSAVSHRKLSKPHFKNVASCMELCFGLVLVTITDISVKTEVFHVIQPVKLGFWHAATKTGMCVLPTSCLATLTLCLQQGNHKIVLLKSAA